MQRGAQVYELNCMACHNVKGLPGMVTGFADNPGIRTPSGANLVGKVLKGGQAVITEGNVTGAGMPSFDWKLSDSDIAAVLTYVRNSWGNAAPEIETEAVTRTRERLGLQPGEKPFLRPMLKKRPVKSLPATPPKSGGHSSYMT